MRILIVDINYAPELTGIARFCRTNCFSDSYFSSAFNCAKKGFRLAVNIIRRSGAADLLPLSGKFNWVIARKTEERRNE